MTRPDRLKHGESRLIQLGCIGTPRDVGDLGSAWLSAARAEGRSNIDARTVHITTSDRREARSMRLRLLDTNALETAQSELITTEELARMLRVDPSSVRRWRTVRPLQGQPYIQLSERVIMYAIEDVREWLSSRRVRPEAA
jgi:hypothetical protein